MTFRRLPLPCCVCQLLRLSGAPLKAVRCRGAPLKALHRRPLHGALLDGRLASGREALQAGCCIIVEVPAAAIVTIRWSKRTRELAK